MPGIGGKLGAARPEFPVVAGDARDQFVELAQPRADVTLAVAAAARIAHARHLGRALGVLHVLLHIGAELEPSGGVIIEVVGFVLQLRLRFERFDHAREPWRRKCLPHTEPAQQPIAQRRLARGIVRGTPGQQPQVPQTERGASLRGRGHFQQPYDLRPAPVGDVDLAALEVLAQLGQQSRRLRGEADRAGRARNGVSIAACKRLRGTRCATAVEGHQIQKALCTDRCDRKAHQEAVEKSFGDLVGGYFVGCADSAYQGAVLAACAVVELALVQQREQGVEDRAVRLEYLIDECDRRLRQVAGRLALVAVLLQRADG